MATPFRFRCRNLGLGAALGLISGTLLLAPTAQGSPLPCRVTNASAADVSNDLQASIDSAASGDTLRIAGTCLGYFDVTDKDLTLFGTGYRPTLDAFDAGVPLQTTDADVVLAGSLRLTGGMDSGVKNLRGMLTLTDSVRVCGNTSTAYGGGILNVFGSVRVTDRARVTHNSAWRGGGIGSFGGSVTLAGVARVSSNTASDEGGGIAVNGRWGDTVLSGSVAVTQRSSISQNTSGRNGGAIEVTEGGGVVTIADRARIVNNVAGNWGGGTLQTVGWTTQLSGHATVSGNRSAHGAGGGLSNAGGTLVLSGSTTVSANLAMFGGGIASIDGVARLSGRATVTANSASNSGGGIYSDRGVLTGAVAGQGGNVFLNTPDDIVFQP